MSLSRSHASSAGPSLKVNPCTWPQSEQRVQINSRSDPYEPPPHPHGDDLWMSKCDNKVAKQLGNEAARHEEARCRGDVVTKRRRGNKQVRGRGCMAIRKRHNEDMVRKGEIDVVQGVGGLGRR
uniref:Uncharacterized protein n=1 Tax=Oryza barthii TaxID=65489 RepID=A0A0D3HNH5_9ORYZ